MMTLRRQILQTIGGGGVDILTGGFPCQPYSTAGKRKGTADPRHLWPHMLRAIREIRPGYIVGENVRGLISWNDGLVFEQVCVDLENEGYEVQPVLLPACGVNAPHQRYRVFFIAHAGSNGHQRNSGFIETGCAPIKSKIEQSERQRVRRDIGRTGATCIVTHTPGQPKREPANEPYTQSESGQTRFEFGGISWRGFTPNPNRHQRPERRMYTYRPETAERYTGLCDTWEGGNAWGNFPTQPPVCGGNDGLPTKLDGIAFSKWRRESLKGYGNAVVPQVALQLFKIIEGLNLL